MIGKLLFSVVILFSSAGSPPLFSDDFADGTLTWIPATGSTTWSETSGNLTITHTVDGFHGALFSAAADSTPDTTSTFNQYGYAQFSTLDSGMGLWFDANGATVDSTSRLYYASVDPGSPSTIYIGDCTSLAGSSCVDINPFGNTACGTFAAGNYFAVEWTTSGTTSVTAKYWRFTSTPPARGSWGAECGSDSGTLRAAPIGKGIGVQHFASSSSGTHSFDNFAGGDQ